LSNLKSDVEQRGKIRLSWSEVLVVGDEDDGCKKTVRIRVKAQKGK
jgi:hypothetical protein